MIIATDAYNAANALLIKHPVFAFVIDGYTRVFCTQPGFTFSGIAASDWIVSIEDQTLTINDLDGGADLADLVFTVSDRGQAITRDFASFVFEGKRITMLQGYIGLAASDFVTLFVGKIDSIESTNGNSEYVFTCPDLRQELSKVIYGTGDDGFPTDSSHPRTLNGNPLDILLAALTAEVGLSSDDVDFAKIEAYRNKIYAGAQMKFTITSPPAAKDFLENEIMKPLGAYLWPNNLGQISVNFYFPISATPVFAFSGDDVVDIPESGPADLINQVNVRMDYDSNDTPQLEIVRQDAASVAKYGLYGQMIIESKGLRSGLQGALLGAFVAFLIFSRYSAKQIMFGSSNSGNGNAAPLNGLWKSALVQPGDIVTLTHAQVPDRVNGVMGVTGQTLVVMDRTYQFDIGIVQFKLLAVDTSIFRQFLITADGEASYLSAGGDQATRMFQTNDSDTYSNGVAGNTLA